MFNVGVNSNCSRILEGHLYIVKGSNHQVLSSNFFDLNQLISNTDTHGSQETSYGAEEQILLENLVYSSV